MKKILKILVCLILVIIIGTVLVLVYPNFNKKHTLKEFNITFKAPIHYEQIETERMINFKSNRNGIGISIYKFEKEFLGTSDITQKVENYRNLIKAKQYDSVTETEDMKIRLISDKVCVKHVISLKNLKNIKREETIIIPNEEYDVIFTIFGEEEQIEKNQKQIDKILGSIKLK